MKRSLEKSTHLMKNRSSKKWHTTDRTQIIAKKLCLRAINEFHLAINEYHRIDNIKKEVVQNTSLPSKHEYQSPQAFLSSFAEPHTLSIIKL